MAKGYRTDVVGKKNFPQEISQYKSGPVAERVKCPVADCECTYEMYGYAPSNRQDNIAKLQERLQKEHPGHTSEVLAVNEFRRRK